MHKIFRCSHLITHYFSKTIVEKKRIVDIYLLKIVLVTSVATGCGACVDIVYEHRALSVTDRGKTVEVLRKSRSHRAASAWKSYG